MTLSWQAPDSDGGAPHPGLRRHAVPRGRCRSRRSRSTPGRRPQTIDRARERRDVHVHGRGAGTRSAWAIRRCATAPKAIGVPTAPSDVKIAPGDGAVRLSWIRPADTQRIAGITGYVVTPFLVRIAQPSHAFASAATIRDGRPASRTVCIHVRRRGHERATGPGRSRTHRAAWWSAPRSPRPTSSRSRSPERSRSRGRRRPRRNGGAVTGYVVTPYIGDRAQAAHDFNSHATHQTINGLRAGTDLQLQGRGQERVRHRAPLPPVEPGQARREASPTGSARNSARTLNRPGVGVDEQGDGRRRGGWRTRTDVAADELAAPRRDRRGAPRRGPGGRRRGPGALGQPRRRAPLRHPGRRGDRPERPRLHPPRRPPARGARPHERAGQGGRVAPRAARSAAPTAGDSSR